MDITQFDDVTAKVIGRRHFHAYVRSRVFAGMLDWRELDPRDAMKMFLSNAKEFEGTIRRPMDGQRAAWIEGWKEARAGYEKAGGDASLHSSSTRNSPPSL